ncbi:hypothetical protein [Furfurilactobacillus entadae]|uniref:hypothetical protein n=1 Tax=Furfurilactobacillus entadae TaxID=2922307 RepID=UPI0035EC6DBA
MKTPEATRFDMVSVVANANTQNIDAFDYALQTALTNHAELGIIVWIDDDQLSVFNALTPRYMKKMTTDAQKFAADLCDVAKAMGVSKVSVTVKQGSNLARLTEEVYCTDFSYDLLVIGEDRHDRQQIQRAVNFVMDDLECAAVVL